MVFFEADCILPPPKEVGGVNLKPWSLHWQTRDNTVWLDGKAELLNAKPESSIRWSRSCASQSSQSFTNETVNNFAVFSETRIRNSGQSWRCAAHVRVVLFQTDRRRCVVSRWFCTDPSDRFSATSPERLFAWFLSHINMNMRSRWSCPCYLAACALIGQPQSEKDAAGPKCVVMSLWKSQQSVSVLLLGWLQCCSHVTGLMWVMEGLLNSAQQGQTHRGLHTHPERGRGPLCWAAAPSAGSFRATTLDDAMCSSQGSGLYTWMPLFSLSSSVLLSQLGTNKAVLFCFKSTIQGVKVVVRSGRQQWLQINHQSVLAEIVAGALRECAQQSARQVDKQQGEADIWRERSSCIMHQGSVFICAKHVAELPVFRLLLLLFNLIERSRQVRKSVESYKGPQLALCLQSPLINSDALLDLPSACERR